MTREFFNRIERIDRLIRTKATGSPDQLANRLGISKRCVFDYLNIMRENGAPIEFSFSRQSYYYVEEGSFTISFIFQKSDAISKTVKPA